MPGGMSRPPRSGSAPGEGHPVGAAFRRSAAAATADDGCASPCCRRRPRAPEMPASYLIGLATEHLAPESLTEAKQRVADPGSEPLFDEAIAA